MDKLCTLGGAVVAGCGGSLLGGAPGLEFFDGFVLSGHFSLPGDWDGWKLAQRLKQTDATGLRAHACVMPSRRARASSTRLKPHTQKNE
jgi:hypothetical protein